MTESAEPEKTNPTPYELSAAQWAARRLAHQECSERGAAKDLDLFDSLFQAERKRIASSRPEIDAAVKRFTTFLNDNAERNRETPESEAQFYRDVSAVPYDTPAGEPIPNSFHRKTFDSLPREQRTAISGFVLEQMGYTPGQAPITRMDEYRRKCEVVADDDEFLTEAMEASRSRPRER